MVCCVRGQQADVNIIVIKQIGYTVTASVNCVLKLSKIAKAGLCSPRFSRIFSMYGMMMHSTYCIMVSSLDQCFLEWPG